MNKLKTKKRASLGPNLSMIMPKVIIPKDMPKIVLTIHNEDPETESQNRFCIIEVANSLTQNSLQFGQSP